MKGNNSSCLKGAIRQGSGFRPKLRVYSARSGSSSLRFGLSGLQDLLGQVEGCLRPTEGLGFRV